MKKTILIPEMRKKYKYLLTLFPLVLLMLTEGKAQSNLFLYNSDNLFNASNYNPAFLSPEEKFTFSIIPLAGTSINYNNQEALSKVSDLLFFDKIDDALKDVFKSMVNTEMFYQHAEMALINFSYRSPYGSFNFSVKDNVRLMLNFRGDFSKFVMNTTYQTVAINEPQAFPAEALHYREYSLGYANEIIKDKLIVGIRGKLYFGKSFLSSDVSAAVTESDNNFYIESWGQLKLSVPAKRVIRDGHVTELVPFDNYGVSKYLFNSKNFGTGFDIGFNYKITPDLSISASVTDIGKINWKENLNTMVFGSNYQLKNNDVIKLTENGVDILAKSDEEISLVDSIATIFELSPVDETSFSKSLPASFYAGLQYQLNPRLKVGLVDRYIKADKLNYNSLSATVNYQANNHFSFITGYSVFGGSLINIPLGAIYKWDSGQAYLGTDNFLSLLSPQTSEFRGYTFGACFYLFRPKIKYKKIYYLPFFKLKKRKPHNQRGLVFKRDS